MQIRNISSEIGIEKGAGRRSSLGLRRSILAGLTAGAGLLALASTTTASFAAGQPRTHVTVASVSHQQSSARHATNWYAVFAGTWVGPAFGTTGACGTEVGVMKTTAKRFVIYTTESEDCANFSSWGHFYTKGSYIHTYWTGTDCAECRVDDWTVIPFHIVNLNTINFYDSGHVFQYHRERN